MKLRTNSTFEINFLVEYYSLAIKPNFDSQVLNNRGITRKSQNQASEKDIEFTEYETRSSYLKKQENSLDLSFMALVTVKLLLLLSN